VLARAWPAKKNYSQNGLTVPTLLLLEGNDRLSSFYTGKVRENFLINQRMSTFTPEIRIESAKAARVPRCWSIGRSVPVNYIAFLLEGLNWEKSNFSILV
jgi:hypothetical protein